MVFAKVPSTKLVLQEHNSSGNLTAQDFASAGFCRVHYGTANVWFVRRKICDEKSPAYVEPVRTRWVSNLRMSPTVMGKVAHMVWDKIALANTNKLSILKGRPLIGDRKNNNMNLLQMRPFRALPDAEIRRLGPRIVVIRPHYG